MTAALWASEPLPPKWPDSTYFLALSQRPPALAMRIARKKPLNIAPLRYPARPLIPVTKPTMRVVLMVNTINGSSSLRAPLVAMVMHAL